MNTPGCCHLPTSSPLPRPTVSQRIRETVRWSLPTAVLILLPKCPACIVAYIAIAGVGISLASAARLEFVLASLSLTALGYLGTRLLLRTIHGSPHLSKP